MTPWAWLLCTHCYWIRNYGSVYLLNRHWRFDCILNKRREFAYISGNICPSTIIIIINKGLIDNSFIYYCACFLLTLVMDFSYMAKWCTTQDTLIHVKLHGFSGRDEIFHAWHEHQSGCRNCYDVKTEIAFAYHFGTILSTGSLHWVLGISLSRCLTERLTVIRFGG